jgi:hypothetical protein
MVNADAAYQLGRKWACNPMVGRSSGTLPTTVQILVLKPFPEFISRFSGVML